MFTIERSFLSYSYIFLLSFPLLPFTFYSLFFQPFFFFVPSSPFHSFTKYNATKLYLLPFSISLYFPFSFPTANGLTS